MDITKSTVIELKALKCDLYEQISIAQQNLQVVNAELKKREDEVKEEKKK